MTCLFKTTNSLNSALEFNYLGWWPHPDLNGDLRFRKPSARNTSKYLSSSLVLFELANYIHPISLKFKGVPATVRANLGQAYFLSTPFFRKILHFIKTSLNTTSGEVSMAKRFTDTTKWDKESFQSLSLKLKLVWQYLCDKCDHAGIWDINLGLISFQIGTKVSMQDLRSLGDKIEFLGNKIHIPAFVEFQYGVLNPENRVHESVLKRLESLKNKDLVSPFQGAKDKEEDMDKDKVKDKDKEKDSISENENSRRTYPFLDLVYFDFIQPIKEDLITAWVTTYAPEYLALEISKAKVWCIANEKKKPKKPGPFLSNWFSRGWENYRKSLPSNKAVPDMDFSNVFGPDEEIA